MSVSYNDFNGLTVTPEKYPPFKSGIYKLKLLEVIPDDGKWKPIFNLIFEVAENCKFKGWKLRGIVNQDLSINGKLWQAYRALTGKALKKDERIYLKELIGNECFAEVENRRRYCAITEYINPKTFAGIERDDSDGKVSHPPHC